MYSHNLIEFYNSFYSLDLAPAKHIIEGTFDILIIHECFGLLVLKYFPDHTKASGQLEAFRTSLLSVMDRSGLGSSVQVFGIFADRQVEKETAKFDIDDLWTEISKLPQIDNKSFSELLRCFAVPFLLAPKFTVDNDVKSFIFDCLTHEQYDALRISSNKAFISGPPGSGKTQILMRKAKELMLADRRVAIICKNRPLCCALAKKLNVSFVDGTSIPKTKSFVATSEKIEKEFPTNGSLQFWNNVDILFDEGQDFPVLVYRMLECSSRDHRITWTFFDNNQKLGSNPDLVVLNGVYHCELSCVIRCTVEIFNFSKSLLKESASIGHNVSGDIVDGNLCYEQSGVQPDLLAAGLVRHFIDKYITKGDKTKEYSPNEATILFGAQSFADRVLGILKKLPDYSEMITTNAEEKENENRKIIMDGAERFSGLEDKIVFVIDFQGPGKGPLADQGLLLRALTRATHKLLIGGSTKFYNGVMDLVNGKKNQPLSLSHSSCKFMC